MNNAELIVKINGYFRTPYSDGQKEEIRDWMNRRLKSDMQRDNLWNDIKNKLKYVPLIKDLEDFINNGEPVGAQSYTSASSLSMSVDAIYVRIKNIRKRQDAGETLKNADIDFLAQWSKVEYYWESAVDASKDPYEVSDMIKNFIEVQAQLPPEKRATVPVVSFIGVKDIEGYIATVLKNKITGSEVLNY